MENEFNHEGHDGLARCGKFRKDKV
jgi:hypothetical protein